LINENTYCTGPYSEVRINSDGSMNFCHYAAGEFILPSENIKELTVDDYFQNSSSIVNARTNLEKGNKISRCYKCYNEESKKLISFRLRRNIQAAIFPGPDLRQSYLESSFSKFNSATSKPKFYHISFNNVCNLSCLMCGPDSSTLLGKNLIKSGISSNKSVIVNDWTNTAAWDNFLDHLIKNDQIVCLHIMGGEPFFQPKFVELLKFLIDHDRTDFHFTVVTNGTIYNNDIINFLKKFKSVQIEISIETVSLSNDYIRYPGKTVDIVNNIKQFSQHQSSSFDVVIRTVPQLLSVLDYDLILEFCLDNQLTIDSNVLHYPLFLVAGLLPNELKELAISKIKKFISRVEDSYVHEDSIKLLNVRDRGRLCQGLIQNANLVITQISSIVENRDNCLKELLNYCVKIDKFRNYDIRNYIPELADFFNSLGYDKARY